MTPLIACTDKQIALRAHTHCSWSACRQVFAGSCMTGVCPNCVSFLVAYVGGHFVPNKFWEKN